jgi:hypothetical protein
MSGTTMSNALELTLGERYSSFISNTETERFFVFPTVVGNQYSFRTFGNEHDYYAHAYDSSGTEFASDDDGAGDFNPLITFTARTELTYFKVRGYSNPDSRVTFEALITEYEAPPLEEPTIVYCTASPIYGYGRRHDLL